MNNVKHPISFRVSESTLKEIDELARAWGMSRSEVCVISLKHSVMAMLEHEKSLESAKKEQALKVALKKTLERKGLKYREPKNAGVKVRWDNDVRSNPSL